MLPFRRIGASPLFCSAPRGRSSLASDVRRVQHRFALVAAGGGAVSYTAVSEAQLDEKLLQFRVAMAAVIREMDAHAQSSAASESSLPSVPTELRVSSSGVVERVAVSVADTIAPRDVLAAVSDRFHRAHYREATSAPEHIYAAEEGADDGSGSGGASHTPKSLLTTSSGLPPTMDATAYCPATVDFIRSQLTNSGFSAGTSVAYSRTDWALSPDALIENQTKSSQPEGRSPWDELEGSRQKMDTFDCNNKQAWVDTKTEWCHLCDEPVGGAFGIHIGDRDHMCLQLFLSIYARYPHRQAGPDCESLPQRAAKVLAEAARDQRLRGVYDYAACPYSQEHLHTLGEAQRRAELTALLVHLCHPPHMAITHVLQGRSEPAFWHSGERMFRGHFSRTIAQMFPPMSAGVQTQFTHKCYGRTNLERMYDALRIADVQRQFGAEPQQCRDSKAQFMRLLMWNLLDAPVRLGRRGAGNGGGNGNERGEQQQQQQQQPAPFCGSGGDDTFDAAVVGSEACHADADEMRREVTIELVRLARQRLVFECIYLQSMQLMNRVQGVVRRMGYPTYEELRKMNVL